VECKRDNVAGVSNKKLR